MKKEYIEREALKRDLVSKGFYPAIVKKAVETIPAADVAEVKRGRWIKDGHFKACSKCRMEVSNRTIGNAYWKYCPHCGAKMDGDGVE